MAALEANAENFSLLSALDDFNQTDSVENHYISVSPYI